MTIPRPKPPVPLRRPPRSDEGTWEYYKHIHEERTAPGVRPFTLYHYTSSQAVASICSASGSLYASRIDYLNDAAEFTLGLELARIAVQRSLPWDEHGERVLTEMEKALKPDSLSSRPLPFVCSFSENGDLLSQWRAYCPKEGGNALGFETQRLIEIADSQGFMLMPCEYEGELQYGLIASATLRAVEDCRARCAATPTESVKHVEVMTEAFVKAVLSLAPIMKHEAFEEEKEWRLISIEDRVDQGKIQYRPSASMMIPYVPFQLRDGEGNMDILEAIIGPMPHAQLAEASMRDFLDRSGIKFRNVRRSRAPYRPL